MSTATATTKSVQKKPKKDYKQELLEQIQQKYGLEGAVTYEEILKNKSKQMKTAMIDNGIRDKDVARVEGIDLSSLDKPSPNTDLLGQLMQNQEQVQAEGISQQSQQSMRYQTKPSSSPFGFGGATLQDGNIVEQQPGMIAGLLSGLLRGNPNYSAEQDIGKIKGITDIQQNQQMQSETKGVYEFDPYKGGINKVGDIPAGSELRNRYADPSELIGERTEASKDLFKYKETGKRETEGRVQMASNLDVMEGLLTDMETYINENPNVFIKGLNPLAEREFKAILSNYDKVAAIAAGGKQLTQTELKLIRDTRPTLLDTKNSKAIAYKFGILKNTIGLAKERLNKATQYENKEQPQQNSQQGWTQDKESRYQELLKKRGK